MHPNAILISILCAAVASHAAAASGRYAITPERVAAAVTGAGLEVTPGQVTLLANVVASVAEPELKVRSIDRTGDRRLVARLQCVDSAQCLPFIVALRVDEIPIAIPHPAVQQAPAAKPPVVIVHAGSRATLLLDGLHVHITLPVISMENGAMGQTIRAASLDRQQVYIVRVVSDGILEGRL